MLSFTKYLKKIAATLAAPTQVYFLSMVSILWGQGLLIINKWIFFDLLIIYLILSFAFWVLRRNLGILGEVEAIDKGEKPV